MFAVGKEVVDRQFFAEGQASIGLIQEVHAMAHPVSVLVEWPDGLEEVMPIEDLMLTGY